MYGLFVTAAVMPALALFSSLLMAAPNPVEQNLILKQQERLLHDQHRRFEELKSLPGTQAAPLQASSSSDARCFTINTIDLKGADALSESERRGLTQPYLGQCLGVQHLNDLLKRITGRYIERGLITSRAYLPQQDLSTAHLQVLIVEGRLEKLKSHANSGLSDRQLKRVFPGRDGQLVNLREIEQMVDQLNRVPSNQAQIELAPGQVVGGSEVLVKNTPHKPWRVKLSRTNGGHRSTGEQQWNVGLEWDNTLGLADQLHLHGAHDAMTDSAHTSRYASLAYNLPWGWWNFGYNYSEGDVRSQLPLGGFDFTQKGDSQLHQALTERVIHRDALSKSSLSVGLSHLRTNNYIEDAHLASSSNRISEVQYGIKHGRRVGGAFFNVDLGMQQGVGTFAAQDNGQSRSGSHNVHYRKYMGTASYLQPFKLWGESLTFTSLLAGQRSNDDLLGPQRMSLGGLAAVRGYKDQFISANSGGYWRNELRLTRPVTLHWLRPIFSEYGTAVGYDQGVTRDDHCVCTRPGRVSSNAFEFFTRGQHIAVSATFARSLERPEGLDRESPIYARLDFFI